MSADASASGDAPRAPALHVVVAAPPAVRRPVDLGALEGVADVVELRLDLLGWGTVQPDEGSAPLRAWIDAAPRPVLATLRSAREGGSFRGTPREAAALLGQAWAAGAAWVDAETDVAPLLRDVDPDRIVRSRHGADALDMAPAESGGPDSHGGFGLHKCALPVNDGEAWQRCVASVAFPGGAPLAGPAFVVPYGALGAARGALFHPSRPGLLFGSADEESAVVPGQPALTTLLDELRAGEVSPQVQLFGLVGTPPSRSPSPAMHNAVFRHTQADALYVPLSGVSLEVALALPLRGLSVTQPYKQAAHAAADSLEGMARQSASVNTLVRDGAHGWIGCDTDADAIVALVEPAPSAGAGAVVYGAGGYARAAACALQARGYAVRIAARDPEAAEPLGLPIAGRAFDRHAGDALVFNATPAGKDGEVVRAFADADLRGLHVLDAPYRGSGEETGLVLQARRQGAARISDGHALLHRQALGQSLLFERALAHAHAPSKGADLTLESRSALLEGGLRPPPSLYLLGTRGAGKSSVGRALARLRGRPFVDLDEEVRRISGRTPAEWIEGQGWAAFRDIESSALDRVCARRGVVVALGGGAVERQGNRDRLAGTGVKIWLQVDAATAARRVADDAVRRPLHGGFADALEEARALLTRREQAWQDLADDAVDGRDSVDEVTRAVAGCWDQHST